MPEAILIPADSSAMPTLHNIPSMDDGQLDAIRKLIDPDGSGFVMVEHIAELGDSDAFGDEEAKLKNVEVEPEVWVEGGVENVRATELIYGDKDEARKRDEQQKQEYRDMGFEVIDAGTGDPREPFIAGNVVLVKRS